MSEQLDKKWESDIDGAVDNLFGQYVVKKPALDTTAEPAPQSPPDLDLSEETPAAPATPEPEIELSLEDAVAPAAAEDGDLTTLFGKMDEAILTIDWEVSSKSLSDARAILSQIKNSSGLGSGSPAEQVLDQMDVVLTAMLESPQNAPVSAPGQLKKAFSAVKQAASQGAQPDSATRKMLSAALSDLYTAVSSGSTEPGMGNNQESAPSPVQTEEGPGAELGELELSLEDNQVEVQEGQAVPAETVSIIRSYLGALDGSIKRILPMEKLFANRQGMEKLHAANRQIREKLTGQQELLASSFSNNFSSYSGLGTVESLLESQLDILKPCVKKAKKLETLFQRTAGYEKLYELTSKVRKSLSEQHDAIIALTGGTLNAHRFDLTGEYEPLQPASSPAAAPATTVAATTDPVVLIDDCLILAKSVNETADPASLNDVGKKLEDNLQRIKTAITSSDSLATPAAAAAAKSSGKCQWDWLLKTSWGGQVVAFAPEQVAYESPGWISIAALQKLSSFALKKLKPWPWSNIQGLFTGPLAKIPSAELNKMEFEIAVAPDSFPGSTGKKGRMLILFADNIGKVFLLDSPTDGITVGDDSLWTPASPGSDIVGSLTMFGNDMPVIALS